MQIKYVSYGRVSSQEQKKNTSVRGQLQLIDQDVQQMFPGSTKVKEFTDVASAWEGDRPGLLKAYRYLKWYQQVADYPATHLLVLVGDRFYRNKDKAGEWRTKFKEIGIEINATREWVDYQDSGQVIVQSVREALAQAESMKNSERTKRGMRQRMREGDWIFDVHLGYRKSDVLDESGRRAIVIDPEAARLKVKALSLIAGGMTMKTAWRECGGREKLGSYNAFTENLISPFDLGLIDYTFPDGERIQARGNHPPIVTKELQNAAKRQMKARERSQPRKTERLARNPLRQVLCCPKCGGKLTSSTPRRGKRINEYYSCYQRGCTYNLRRAKAHRHMHDLVMSIQAGPEAVKRLEKKANQTVAKNALQADLRAAIAQNDVRQQRLAKALDMRLDGEIDASDLVHAKKLAQQTQERVNECRLAVEGFEQMRAKMSAAFANIGESVAVGLKDDAPPEMALKCHDFLKMLFPDGLCLVPETTIFGTSKPNQILVSTGLLSVSYEGLEPNYPLFQADSSESGGKPGTIRTLSTDGVMLDSYLRKYA